jgi:hypothetical protein
MAQEKRHASIDRDKNPALNHLGSNEHSKASSAKLFFRKQIALLDKLHNRLQWFLF